MRRFLFFFSFLMVSFTLIAQKSVNNYKYVVVPKTFKLLKTPDRYQTSSLTKFLFNKYGFTAFIDSDNLPNELVNNQCMTMFVDLKSQSSKFLSLTTKVVITLQDCNGTIIFESEVGRSKLKDLKKAYQEAIRKAFRDVNSLDYRYKPSAITKQYVVPKKVTKKSVTASPDIVKKEKLPIKSTITPKVTSGNKVNDKFDLYATSNLLGYKMKNSASKVIFTLLKTEKENVYIIKGKNGIFYKKGTRWLADFYKKNKRIHKEYKVRF